MKYQETREKVLEVAVKCLEKGLIHGTAGNVSMRVPGEDVVIITPTRIPYVVLCQDLVQVKMRFSSS